MKVLLIILQLIIAIVFSCMVVEIVAPSPPPSTLAVSPGRPKRTIFPFVRKFLAGYSSKCGSRSCPTWKCQDDSAVIHGYCCHCPGWQSDRVPVPCYPDLKCPISPEPLCTDYNFMMECCCTGP